MRLAYCTGMRRWACSTKTTRATITRPTATTTEKTPQPRERRICHSEVGKPAAIEVKISSDMPLPMPRSVMSSPSHMTTAVPAVMVKTMTSTVNSVSLGTMSSVQFWKRRPGSRAIAMRPVDCRIASATVR